MLAYNNRLEADATKRAVQPRRYPNVSASEPPYLRASV